MKSSLLLALGVTALAQCCSGSAVNRPRRDACDLAKAAKDTATAACNLQTVPTARSMCLNSLSQMDTAIALACALSGGGDDFFGGDFFGGDDNDGNYVSDDYSGGDDYDNGYDNGGALNGGGGSSSWSPSPPARPTSTSMSNAMKTTSFSSSSSMFKSNVLPCTMSDACRSRSESCVRNADCFAALAVAARSSSGILNVAASGTGRTYAMSLNSCVSTCQAPSNQCFDTTARIDRDKCNTCTSKCVSNCGRARERRAGGMSRPRRQDACDAAKAAKDTATAACNLQTVPTMRSMCLNNLSWLDTSIALACALSGGGDDNDGDDYDDAAATTTAIATTTTSFKWYRDDDDNDFFGRDDDILGGLDATTDAMIEGLLASMGYSIDQLGALGIDMATLASKAGQGSTALMQYLQGALGASGNDDAVAGALDTAAAMTCATQQCMSQVLSCSMDTSGACMLDFSAALLSGSAPSVVAAATLFSCFSSSSCASTNNNYPGGAGSSSNNNNIISSISASDVLSPVMETCCTCPGWWVQTLAAEAASDDDTNDLWNDDAWNKGYKTSLKRASNVAAGIIIFIVLIILVCIGGCVFFCVCATRNNQQPTNHPNMPPVMQNAQYEPGQAGYPPQQQAGYPPQQQAGYPPQQQAGYPPQQQAGYPPQQQPGYPPNETSA